MADSVFKDLVIDAQDAARMAAFWSAALGLESGPAGTGPDAVLTGDAAEHTIWINQVPEPHTAKQRAHLDVLVAELGELTDLGATIADIAREDWVVMRDPEGGEFCAFFGDPETLKRYRVHDLVVDSADPEAICRWWGERFGVEPRHDDSGPWFWLEGAGLPWPMVFNPVPEAKTVKNAVHWDVWGTAETFLSAGASVVRRRDEEIGWDVLADPEGNEFCVFERD
jgi:hypothetical protein